MAKEILEVVGAVVVCQLAGVFGSFYTRAKIPGWYKTLKKPSFNPPNWIFAPVWIVLYTLMGLALYRIWAMPDSASGRPAALIFFFTQLLLNALWSYIFFGMEELRHAFKEILALWVFIVLSIQAFAALDVLAAWLLAPYLAWVTFAAVLNFSIARLNPKKN
jgi:translocator protein